MSRLIQFVNTAGVWEVYSREGDEGQPFRFYGEHDTYLAARTQRLALDGETDRVQWIDSGRKVVLAEFCREPGDLGCLRPVEELTPLGIVGHEPICPAVPISRAVLNSRPR